MEVMFLNYLIMNNYFKNGLSFFMENLIYFHDVLLLVCYFVVFFMFSLMGSVLYFNSCYLKKLGNVQLEVVWTVLPIIILLMIIEPSLHLLYLSESFSFKKGQVVKVVGHQWYWSYKCDFINSYSKESMDYDSFMVSSTDLSAGDFRLLEVDLPLVLWADTPAFFLVTSADVIHSFAIPVAGIKVDAFPGRLNIGVTSGLPVGCYWGQCSEICGANHAFMPMGIESVL